MKSAPAARRSAAVSLGLLLDAALGEPPTQLHPIAWFGRGMRRLQRASERDSRAAGALHVAAGVGAGYAAGRVASSTTAAVAICSSGRMLRAEARAVAQSASRGDLDQARGRARSLVSRETASLSEAALARAAVESLSENTSDAVTATALWALVGGAPAAYAQRASNTLDAMIGYRSERYEQFGYVAARLDDVLNFPAARATAVVVMLVRPRRARAVLACLRADARNHASLNSGVAEAAFAGALGVQLGGPTTYAAGVTERPTIGRGRQPELADVERAARLSRDVQLALAALAALPVAVSLVRRRARPAGCS